MTDDNKRLPRTTKSDGTKWEYPWNQVTASPGGHEIHINSTPGEESTRHFHPAGTFTEVHKDGTSINLTAGKHYHTSSSGSTNTVEGAKDQLVLRGTRNNNLQGQHSETAEDVTHGIYGQNITSSKGQGLHYSQDQINHSGPGVFHDQAEDQHQSIAGDFITFIQGTKYDQINEEYGIHVPNGNMDLQIDSGQFRIKSGQDLKIESDTKITLKVGSSTIVIESGSITIKSSSIKFEQS